MNEGVKAAPVRQNGPQSPVRWQSVVALAAVTLVAACGGGGGGSDNSSARGIESSSSIGSGSSVDSGTPTGGTTGGSSTGGTTGGSTTGGGSTGGSSGTSDTAAPEAEPALEQGVGYVAPTGSNVPTDRNAAARFLTQATFGPTDGSVQRVMDLGYSQWIDEQFAQTPSSHRVNWDSLDGPVKAVNPRDTIGANGVPYSFWRVSLKGPDQLRQRVALALSQIFVISMVEPAVGDNPRAAAHYLDVLATTGLTNYRDLLEAVTLHPMMGRYLSAMGNRKADANSGRVPDENFAREVMQLFSIGLYELNLDGTRKLSNGAPIETYTPADIAGMAKVFTGWSWACPVGPSATNSTCFTNGTYNNQSDPNRHLKPMIAYPQQHSPEAKQFLGQTVAAGTSAPASLKVALDRLATHPNTAPFISKQLIQRLVTSNPTPAYVQRVASVFNSSRGDMKAVVKAILLDTEARTPGANGGNGGKVREPLLRMTATMRAFGYASDTGWYKLGNTDDPGLALGQTVLRSPSVFNYYRPGYVAPGSQAAAAGLVAPEMQIVHETSSAGYVTYMREVVAGGIGQVNGAPYNRRDMQPNFNAELALAGDPAALVAQVDRKLMYGTMPESLKTLIVNAVASTQWRRAGVSGFTQAQNDTDRRVRVNTAVFLTVVSPEFLVQK